MGKNRLAGSVRGQIPGLARALLIFMVTQPVLALLYAASYALTAAALNGALADTTELLFRALLRDSRHARIAADAAGQIHVSGLAVGWPLDHILPWLAAGWVLPTAHVPPERWSSAVVEPGSTLLAGIGCDLLALTLLLGLARAFKSAGRRAGRGSIALAGMIAEVGIVLEILRQPLTIEDLDAVGLSSIATKVFQAAVPDYRSFLAPFERAEGIGLPIAPLMLLVGIGALVYGLPGMARLAGSGCSVIVRHASAPVSGRGNSPGSGRALTAVKKSLPVLCAVLATLSPLQWARGGPSFLPFPIEGISEASAGEVLDVRETGSRVLPSLVQITGEHPAYQLTVNGSPLRIRGIGYNVYAAHLSASERSAHYERDFRVLRDSGINTILGWEQREFDEVMLDKAFEMGLWVILPYQLSPHSHHINYADRSSRAELKASLARWVTRFRDHPALLMYAPGNEVLTAMRTYFLQDVRQQRAYASFFREAADLIHSLDPNHPVICREAEIGYAEQLKEAFEDDRDRPWFVLGTNLYGTLDTVQDGLGQRVQSSWHLPGVVTEFSPVGYRRHDRPHFVTRMTQMVEAAGLLGWVLYVWTVEGPEPLDRTFGIVDGHARPVDGTLRALRTFNATGSIQAPTGGRRAASARGT